MTINKQLLTLSFAGVCVMWFAFVLGMTYNAKQIDEIRPLATYSIANDSTDSLLSYKANAARYDESKLKAVYSSMSDNERMRAIVYD